MLSWVLKSLKCCVDGPFGHVAFVILKGVLSVVLVSAPKCKHGTYMTEGIVKTILGTMHKPGCQRAIPYPSLDVSPLGARSWSASWQGIQFLKTEVPLPMLVNILSVHSQCMSHVMCYQVLIRASLVHIHSVIGQCVSWHNASSSEWCNTAFSNRHAPHLDLLVVHNIS